MGKLGLLVVVIASAACGGDPSTGPVPQAVAQDLCRETCEHDAVCDPNSGETVEACTADCVAGVTGAIREDAFIEIADCIAGLACTVDEDTCTSQCTPTGTHDTYETRCRSKGAECGITGTELDGLCEVTPVAGTDTGFFCLFTPALMSELTACYDMPCTGLETCLSAVFDKYGVGG